jgi:hypothetical protein
MGMVQCNGYVTSLCCALELKVEFLLAKSKVLGQDMENPVLTLLGQLTETGVLKVGKYSDGQNCSNIGQCWRKLLISPELAYQ